MEISISRVGRVGHVAAEPVPDGGFASVTVLVTTSLPAIAEVVVRLRSADVPDGLRADDRVRVVETVDTEAGAGLIARADPLTARLERLED